MTRHYTIEVIESKTFLKITYRDKKFRKLEHVRGKLDKVMMKYIGRILPHNEDDIGSFSALHNNRVNYSIVVKEESLFGRFVSEWSRFYEDQTTVQPKFTGADGKALNQIIAYLKKINAGDEAKALELWQVILSSYDKLDQFYKDNLDLKIINSKLNVIIRQIQRHQAGQSASGGGTVGL